MCITCNHGIKVHLLLKVVIMKRKMYILFTLSFSSKLYIISSVNMMVDWICKFIYIYIYVFETKEEKISFSRDLNT